jgi:hypothetical protein
MMAHLLGRDVIERSVDAEAGVGHHHVEAAEPRERAIGEHLQVVRVCNVGDDRQRLTARGRDLRRRRVESIAAPRADDEFRAVARKPDGRCPADTRRRSGNCNDTHHAASITFPKTRGAPPPRADASRRCARS